MIIHKANSRIGLLLGVLLRNILKMIDELKKKNIRKNNYKE